MSFDLSPTTGMGPTGAYVTLIKIPQPRLTVITQLFRLLFCQALSDYCELENVMVGWFSGDDVTSRHACAKRPFGIDASKEKEVDKERIIKMDNKYSLTKRGLTNIKPVCRG